MTDTPGAGTKKWHRITDVQKLLSCYEKYYVDNPCCVRGLSKNKKTSNLSTLYRYSCCKSCICFSSDTPKFYTQASFSKPSVGEDKYGAGQRSKNFLKIYRPERWRPGSCMLCGHKRLAPKYIIPPGYVYPGDGHGHRVRMWQKCVMRVTRIGFTAFPGRRTPTKHLPRNQL
jgi:hypothetical protein